MLVLDFLCKLFHFIDFAVRDFPLQHPDLFADKPVFLILLHLELNIVTNVFNDAFHIESRLQIRRDGPSQIIQRLLLQSLLFLLR